MVSMRDTNKITIVKQRNKENCKIRKPTTFAGFRKQEFEGNMNLLTVVCLFSMEWDCGAARDIWDKASRGSNTNIIFVGWEIIVLKQNNVRKILLSIWQFLVDSQIFDYIYFSYIQSLWNFFCIKYWFDGTPSDC